MNYLLVSYYLDFLYLCQFGYNTTQYSSTRKAWNALSTCTDVTYCYHGDLVLIGIYNNILILFSCVKYYVNHTECNCITL